MSSEIDGSISGTTTQEYVMGRRALVWWSTDALEAFSSTGSRASVLEDLEREMTACGQTTLYYHAAEVDGAYVVFASSEDATALHITVRIGQPMVLDPALVEFLREFYSAHTDAPEG